MTDAFDDLFEAAKDEFPAKEDLKDRLVVIYPTGKVGERKSAATGKMYPWIETTTVVLDDGPEGASFTDLVPSVAAEGPVVLTGFQWSAAGLVARLNPKVGDPKVPGILGRINSMKNKQRGMADAWSIAPPTEDEMNVGRQHADVLTAARNAIKDARAAVADENAFS